MKEYPKILVLKEKYVERYFQIISEKNLYKTALKILSERERGDSWYNYNEDDYQDIKKTIIAKDGKKAWKILKSRSSIEYEDVSLEDYDKI